MADLKLIEDLRKQILSLQARARQLGGRYENRYAKAHLKEIELQAALMLVQLDYAELAAEGRQ